jgi:hypothetical protein
MAEFAFDVLEVARGAFKADTYQDRIGFEVARPVLERAFRDTYGLEVTDVFGDADLAIGTYRRAVSRVIPDMTRLAWREKRDEILAATPDVAEKNVVYTMTRRQYDDAYGTAYRKPGFFARFVVLVFKIVPKFGPFKPLAFEPLTPETEQMFLESFRESTAQYRASLRAIEAGRAVLADVDLDTGRPPVRGANPLADKTYADLLAAFAEKKFVGIPAALRRDINEHYTSGNAPRLVDRTLPKRERKALERLAALNAAVARGR